MSSGEGERLTALDVLRGLAVAGMILVVSPGDWGMTWSGLQHAAWDGWRLADMVFPTFLFSVGLAIALSFPRTFDLAARRLGLDAAQPDLRCDLFEVPLARGDQLALF